MSEPSPAQRAAAVAEGLAAVGAAIAELGVAATAALRFFTDNDAGRQLRELVDYFTDHPEALDAMIEEREREAEQTYCHCLCLRWGHLGSCTTLATEQRTLGPPGQRVTMGLCAPCAAGIDRYRG